MGRFSSGKCINCGEEPISSGRLFCDKCELVPQEKATFIKLPELENGQEGYTCQDTALFVVDGQLYLNGNCLVFNRVTEFHKTKIRREGRQYRVLRSTLNEGIIHFGMPDPPPTMFFVCHIYDSEAT